jgi:CheY-like chemotaxis protein
MARVLVVEDDPTQLEMRTQILENAGYEVAAAKDGAEALERWPGCSVVVMDLRIPKPEDGARLVHEIAGRARIIVLSGGQVDPDLPIDEFLKKPCPSRRLIECIEKWISASK